MDSNDPYWEGYKATLHRIRYEEPRTFAELKAIVDAFHPVMGDIPFSGDTFFPSGGDDTIAEALMDTGWRLRFVEGDYYYVAEHPVTGAVCTYIEGDLYEGRTDGSRRV